jgi:hypothetical protein
MAVSLSLSAQGLEHLPPKEDFQFIVCEKKYACSSIVADFLSPKVAKMHFVDPTLNSYILQSPDPNSLFGEFLAIGEGKSRDFSIPNCGFAFGLASELQNSEVFGMIRRFVSDDLSVDNAVSRLQLGWNGGCDCGRELAFVASHFDSILEDVLGELTKHGIIRIIS